MTSLGRFLAEPACLPLLLAAVAAATATATGCGAGQDMRGDPRSQTVITSASIPLSDETASDDAPTAQGGDPDDRRITGAIRDALHADESLSPAARNTRVVTQNRRVVLRGTVADERERQTVESIARGQAVDVDDEITVAK